MLNVRQRAIIPCDKTIKHRPGWRFAVCKWQEYRIRLHAHSVSFTFWAFHFSCRRFSRFSCDSLRFTRRLPNGFDGWSLPFPCQKKTNTFFCACTTIVEHTVCATCVDFSLEPIDRQSVNNFPKSLNISVFHSLRCGCRWWCHITSVGTKTIKVLLFDGIIVYAHVRSEAYGRIEPQRERCNEMKTFGFPSKWTA